MTTLCSKPLRLSPGWILVVETDIFHTCVVPSSLGSCYDIVVDVRENPYKTILSVIKHCVVHAYADVDEGRATMDWKFDGNRGLRLHDTDSNMTERKQSQK